MPELIWSHEKLAEFRRYQATAGEVEYLIEAHEAGHVELWIAGFGPTVSGEFDSVDGAR